MAAKYQITIIGTGYVGLVQGVVLAHFGHTVTCLDRDIEKIKQLAAGHCPIYEPGLSDLLATQIAEGRLTFTTDAATALANKDMLFIAVGTPAQEDGSADVRTVLSVAHEIGTYITTPTIVVTKSTVPIGTNQAIAQRITQTLAQLKKTVSVEVVSNPEFLREGKALTDCLHPDRIVIGTNTPGMERWFHTLYGPLYTKGIPFLFTDLASAEMIKYAANAFLATKISFINELSLLAEKTGADIMDVAKGMGLDTRIGSDFLVCGPGYGGSCFPKDTQALCQIAAQQGENLYVVNAVIQANTKQKKRMAEKIIAHFNGHMVGKTVAILGLSFKADTDDVRDAPILDIAPLLVEAGARLRLYCPQGIPETKWRLSHLAEAVIYTDDVSSCVTGTDAAVLMTEWENFKTLPLAEVSAQMRSPVLFDFRHLYRYDPAVRRYFTYYPLG